MDKLKTFYFYLVDTSGDKTIIGVEASTMEEACHYLEEQMDADKIEFINESLND